MAFSKIVFYINLAGGLTSTLYCFIFPVLMYFKTNDHSRYHWKNIISFLIMVSGALIGITGGIVTVINQISGREQL